MVYLLDGGLGSELQITGVVKVGDRLWSARPLTSQDGTKRLKAVHLNFLQAGADVVKTASYQLSIDLLRECLPHLSQVGPTPSSGVNFVT
jgi:homocysteine S-methyltransferase